MQKYRSKAINISDEFEPSALTFNTSLILPSQFSASGTSTGGVNYNNGTFLTLSFSGYINELYEVLNGVSAKLLSGISDVKHSYGISYNRKTYTRTGTVTARNGSIITVSWNNDETELSDDGSYAYSANRQSVLKINNDSVLSSFGLWVVGYTSFQTFVDQYVYMESGDKLYDYAIKFDAKIGIQYNGASNNNTFYYDYGKAGSSVVVGDTVTVKYGKVIGTPETTSNVISRLIRLNMIEEYEEADNA